MSDSCCGSVQFDGLSPAYKRTLWVVIAINFTMFVVELTAGISAHSQALQADSLDFLGDSATYAISLMVIGSSLKTRAIAAIFKGASLILLALWVLGSTGYRVIFEASPEPMVMTTVGLLALGANLASVLLLMKYRNGDANVRSVWLCSRNDAINNLAVIIAALLVWKLGQAWPDLLIAALMACLFLSTSVQILRQAFAEYRQGENGENSAQACTEQDSCSHH